MGGISALGSMGASAINAAYSGKNLKRQYKYRTKEIDYSNEQSKKLTEWNNLNSASQQVQGMRLAGLNPAAVNGVSNMVQTAGSSGNYQGAPLGLNFDGVASAAAQGAQMKTQTENVESSTDKNKAEAEKATQDAKAQELANAAEEDKQDAYKRATTGKVMYQGRLYDVDDPLIQDVDSNDIDATLMPSGHKSLEAATATSNVQRVVAQQIIDSNNAEASKNAKAISDKQLALLDVEEQIQKGNLNQIQFAQKIHDAQLENDNVFAALVAMPYLEFEKCRATIADLYASAFEHRSGGKLKLEQTKMEKLMRMYNGYLLTPEYAKGVQEKMYRDADALLDGNLSVLIGASERGSVSNKQKDVTYYNYMFDKGMDVLGDLISVFAQLKGAKTARMNAQTNAKNAETNAKRAQDAAKPQHRETTNFDARGNVTSSQHTDSW